MKLTERELEMVTGGNDGVERVSLPTSYTVAAGDTLWAIASRFYKDGSKWTILYEANKTVIGKDPNKIMPGMALTIPAI